MKGLWSLVSREKKRVAGDKVGQRDLGADMRSYREEDKDEDESD